MICYIVFAKNNDSLMEERTGMKGVDRAGSSSFIFFLPNESEEELLKTKSKGGKKDGQEKKLMGFYV